MTAGGIDSHIHFICPPDRRSSYVWGDNDVGRWNRAGDRDERYHLYARAMEYWQNAAAMDDMPMNLGFLGKGNASLPAALEEQLEAGARAQSFTKTGVQRRRSIIV